MRRHSVNVGYGASSHREGRMLEQRQKEAEQGEPVTAYTPRRRLHRQQKVSKTGGYEPSSNTTSW
jgi:hypothetical protein